MTNPTPMDAGFFQTQAQQQRDPAIVEFYLGTAMEKVDGEKRPVDVDRVRIRLAGRRDVVDTIVTDEHIARFPRQYEAYKTNQEQQPDGYPVKHCGIFSPSERLILESHNIPTVEATAQLNETYLKKIPGGRSLKNRAIEWLRDHESAETLRKRLKEIEAGHADADSDKLKAKEAECRDLKKKLAAGKDKIAQLEDQIAHLKANME